MNAARRLGVPVFESRLDRARSDFEAQLVRAVETSAHLGRLAAALRCLLEADESQRPWIEALAQAALEAFDNWQSMSTGGTVSAFGDRDGAARKDESR